MSAANEAAIELLARVSALAAGDAMLKAMNSQGEAAISAIVQASVSDGFANSLLKPINFCELDTIVFEVPIRSWRADAIVFHVDGSATVIEIKDGARGAMSVLSGIGQCGLYASLLDGHGRTGMKVRRALLWTRVETSAGLDMDQVVREACISAGVTPIWVPPVKDILAERLLAVASCVAGVARELKEAANGAP